LAVAQAARGGVLAIASAPDSDAAPLGEPETSDESGSPVDPALH
jgi:hypothetical protein